MNAKDLLDKAKERLYKQSLMDAEDDNILYVLGREFDETHTHSKILFHLLSTHYKKDKGNSFLHAFLRQIGVPEQYFLRHLICYYQALLNVKTFGQVDQRLQKRTE